MSATLTDVARTVGVSPSTVSRALRGGPVNAATRDAILRAAQDLGYQVNRAARELTTGRTGAIGLVVPDVSNPYFAEVIKGASLRSRVADLPIFVSDTDEELAREHEAITSLRRNTDGLILCAPRSGDSELADYAAAGPTVVINREVSGVPAVIGDEISGIEQALQHLAALGHRRIAYIAGPPGSWTEQHRQTGLAHAEALSIEVVTIPSSTPTFNSGILAADVAMTTQVTAVIAFNDLLALGVLHRLTARGVQVPQDISVIGHDDIDMATMCSPPLTTVAVPKDRFGFTATELLLRLLASPDREPQTGDPDAVVRLPSTLIVRDSTGIAPGAQAHLTSSPSKEDPQ